MSQSLQLFTTYRSLKITIPQRRSYSLPATSYRQSTVTLPKRTTLAIKASSSSPPPELDSSSQILLSDNGKGRKAEEALATSATPTVVSAIEVDTVTEAELKENGFRSTRRTKLVCTIGPATCGFEQLEALAVGGMNVARINMCHGTREWHRAVIQRVRRLNEEKGYAVAIMMDTEGSEIHMGDLGGAPSAKAEVIFLFPLSSLFLVYIALNFRSYILFVLLSLKIRIILFFGLSSYSSLFYHLRSYM